MKNPRHVGNPDALTIVIKLGTSSIVHEQTLQPRLDLLSSLVETVCTFRRLGHRVVLVSSGAIAVGLKHMSLSRRPKILAETQAIAAIGQGKLITLWDNLFGLLDQPIGQVLLTRNDIADRSRYLNAIKTLTSLLAMGVVPIVNENDTLSVSEIRFGDNDTLSAVTAGMVAADYLCLMTDVDCLFTENPRKSPNARPVKVVRDIDAVRAMVSTATLGSSLGTGGMETKLIAAELATGAGVSTLITNSSVPSRLLSILSEETSALSADSLASDHADQSNSEPVSLADVPIPFTIFLPSSADILPDRRWWVAHGLAPRGAIYIDEGAYRAITRHSGNGGRLLPAGVVTVKGSFAAGQSVKVFVVRGYNSSRKSTSKSHSNLSSDTESFATPVTQTTPSHPRRIHTSSGNSTPVSGLSSAEDSVPNLQTLSLTEDSNAKADEDSKAILEGYETLEVGRGLTNYNSLEISRLKGLKSSEIERVLGYIESEHVAVEITPSGKGNP